MKISLPSVFIISALCILPSAPAGPDIVIKEGLHLRLPRQLPAFGAGHRSR